MKDAGLARNIMVARILEEARLWIDNHFGAELSNGATVLSLSRGDIIIRAENHALAREIKLHEREIADFINDKFKGNIVNRIRFTV